MDWLFSFPWYISATLFLTILVVVSVVGLIVVHKVFPMKLLEENNTVGALANGTVSVFYAILMGFIIVGVEARFNALQHTIESEAEGLVDIYRDIGVFSDGDKKAVRQLIRDYVNEVIDHEWGLLAHGLESSVAREKMQRIWWRLYRVNPEGEKQDIWYDRLISGMEQVSENRIIRIFRSEDALGSMIWSLLIVGAFICIGFIYFFGMQNLRAMILMTVFIAITVGFMLYVIFYYDNPFLGLDGIQPTAFRHALMLFDRWDTLPDV
jgi:hypothetical protein